MLDGYGTQRDYVESVRGGADERQQAVEEALRQAFAAFIERREVEIVAFVSMSATDLANALIVRPLILKPLLACCNLAARAVERDLDLRNLDTYLPRLSEGDARLLAGYLKPFLPSYLELPALSALDRVAYVDKEIRKNKGRWETRVVAALNRHSAVPFRKRRITVNGENYELDAATPKEGTIHAAVDVKRIEARRDIHKRCDEIVNKARRLKSAYPGARFGAVLYYPFVDEHVNVQSRLRSGDIDGVVFASEGDASLDSGVRHLLAMLAVEMK
ncbi:MAG: hypothetical protein ACUVX9_17230 [Anaerolineae bacterium]